MCCDAIRYDVMWLVRRLDEVMRLAVRWREVRFAPATKNDSATSPDTAPATQSYTPTSCQLHLFCACRDKWHCNIMSTSPNRGCVTKYNEKLCSNITVTSALAAKIDSATSVNLHQYISPATQSGIATLTEKRMKPAHYCGAGLRTRQSSTRTLRWLFAFLGRILHRIKKYLPLRLPFQVPPNLVPATKSDIVFFYSFFSLLHYSSTLLFFDS